ncbi:MAG TPA: glycosyltransferase [Candidatus Aquilonibacter sp.]|nr:glycosyltransferase [Candidatus Aquilonibacter sp.]
MSLRSIAIVSLHADPSTRVGSLQNGGVTIYVRELARAFARDGARVDVYTRRTDSLQPREETIDGYRLRRIDAGPAAEIDNDAIAEHLEAAYAHAKRLFNGESYDLISSHYWLSGWLGKRLSRDTATPHVHTLHSHGTARRIRDAVTQKRIEIERELLRTERIVTLSTEHREAFMREYSLIPPHLAVVPGGIDLSRFTPGSQSDARAHLGLDPRAQYVGYIGRLAKEKGIDELIASFALLAPLRPHARLFVVGGAKRNSRIGELRALAAHFGIADRVDFAGALPNDAIADAFRACDVIAVPSHYEAFGLVALEARACGIPVVASDVGGLRELVRPRDGGARVAPSQPMAWAQALQTALTEPERSIRRMRALESDLSSYSWQSIAQRIAAFGLGNVTAA